MTVNPFDLRGRCIVVTGISQGIGRAIALVAAGAGAKVAGIHLGTDDVDCEHAETLVTHRHAASAARMGEALPRDDRRGLARSAPSQPARVLLWLPQCRSSDERCAGRHILNVTFTADVLVVAELSAYIAAKGAIVALTKELAVELASRGITVGRLRRARPTLR